MRFPSHHPLGVIAAALLAGCSDDPAATTAPTTPSFSQTSTFVPGHVYDFSLSCGNAAPGSQVLLNVFGDASSLSPTLRCGQSFPTLFVTPAGFQYLISVREIPFGPTITACTDFSNTTGDFKCKSKRWSATLTVTDLGPV